jgi:hypothetical protein
LRGISSQVAQSEERRYEKGAVRENETITGGAVAHWDREAETRGLKLADRREAKWT